MNLLLLGVVRWLHEPKSTMVYPEVLFPHWVGRYRPVGSPSWFQVCWKCRDMEGFLMRGWELNLPVSGATSTLAGGATLAARWLHEPQPISNQPVVVGISIPCGAVSVTAANVGDKKYGGPQPDGYDLSLIHI